jgi:hypothetical protein
MCKDPNVVPTNIVNTSNQTLTSSEIKLLNRSWAVDLTYIPLVQGEQGFRDNHWDLLQTECPRERSAALLVCGYKLLGQPSSWQKEG